MSICGSQESKRQVAGKPESAQYTISCNLCSLLTILPQVWIDVLIRSEALVDLCHVVEKGEQGKKERKGSRVRSRMKNQGTSSAVAESEEDIELELEDDRGQYQPRSLDCNNTKKGAY